MAASKFRDQAVAEGMRMSQRFFAKRAKGKNVEAHLSEADVAALLATAYEMGCDYAAANEAKMIPFKTMTGSHFAVVRVAGSFVQIVDLNGTRSVTNDAHAVVATLYTVFPRQRYFYTDSDGRVDELRHERESFIGYAAGPADGIIREEFVRGGV